MEKVVEKMAKFFGSPIAKWVGIILSFFAMGILSSFTTRVNVEDQLRQFTAQQFEKSVQNVVDTTITPRLKTQEETLARLEQSVSFLGDQAEATIISQIERDYEQYQKGNFSNISDSKLKYDAENWCNVSDKKKTDILKREFSILMDYYARIKK